ncbi:MAG: apolipoprotein N-acyltransferase, partial [Propionibacteriaceae bacterium]|nr:apolipoprotein N-acyltransferase [Propionibacteriaceae bacterium]
LTGACLAWIVCSRTVRLRLGNLVLVVALMVAGGALRWWPSPPADATMRVAMIQGNVDSTADPFSMGYAASVTAMHLGETIMALATWRTSGQAMPDMIVWPENSTDTDPTQDTFTNDLVTDASDLAGIPILLGVISLGPGDDERQTSALWWLPGQGPVARVDKRNLAPFGERVPLYSILGKIVPMTQRVGRQSVPGTKPGIFHVELAGRPLTIGNVICFELAYDQTVYDTVRNGAQLMTVQSSNVSFEGTWQPAEQFAITRVRAMELRRWVVVTTTASLSGLIDPHGKVIDETHEGQAAFRLYTVPLGSGVTPGVYIGPWLEGLVSALAGAGVLFGTIQALRRRRPRPQLAAQTDRVDATTNPQGDLT